MKAEGSTRTDPDSYYKRLKPSSEDDSQNVTLLLSEQDLITEGE